MILKKYCKDIVAYIELNDPLTRYWIDLPLDKIPKSFIATNMTQKFNSLLNLNQNNNIKNIDQLKLGNEIINNFLQLYNKYINESSYFAVNIASKPRQDLKNMFKYELNNNTQIMQPKIVNKFENIVKNNNKNDSLQWLIWELIKFMEVAVCEVSKGLNDAFTRFRKNRKVYLKALELANEKNGKNSKHGKE